MHHPLNTADFSSLLHPQASKAEIIALSNADGETINAIKHVAEFGLGRKSDQRIAALLLQFPGTHALASKRRRDRPEPRTSELCAL
jgi:branched-chain amino acid transport system substrate-binding protein